jgi:hypothetical protein
MKFNFYENFYHEFAGNFMIIIIKIIMKVLDLPAAGTSRITLSLF